jgi:hypothetical protein
MRRPGRGTPCVTRWAAGVCNHGRRHAASRISSASAPGSSGSAAVCGRDASVTVAPSSSGMDRGDEAPRLPGLLLGGVCDRFHLATSLVAHLRTTLALIAICAKSGFERASTLTSLGRSVRTATRVFPALEPSSHRVRGGNTSLKKTYRLCIGLCLN